MNPQNAINLLSKALPLVLDLAGLVPVIGSAASAIRFIEDGITVEQNAYAFLESPEGAPARELITLLAREAGFSGDVFGSIVKPETRDEVQANLDSGVL